MNSKYCLHISAVAVLAFALLFASCGKNKKKNQPNVENKPTADTIISTPNVAPLKASQRKLGQKMYEQVISYDVNQVRTLQDNRARVSLNFLQQNQPSQTLSFRVAISVIADSVISLSFMPIIGIELYRVDIDKQGLLIVDKINKEYISCTYNELNAYSGLHFDYYMMEGILLCRPFWYGMPMADFVEQLDSKHKVMYSDNSFQHSCTLNIEDDNRAVSFLYDDSAISDRSQWQLHTMLTNCFDISEVQVNYQQYALTCGMQFPTSLQIDAQELQHNKRSGQFSIQYNDCQLNQNVTITPVRLDKYKQTQLRNLFR